MDTGKILVVLLGVLILYQMGYLGGAGAPATGGVTTTTVQVPPESATVTLSAVDKYATGTSRTTEFAKIYVKDTGGWVDRGLISLNSGTFSADALDSVRIYFAENSSTYYTQKLETQLPATKGQPKYQGELITIDTGVTMTYYNDDDQPNTAQVMGASTTKTVGLKYAATSVKGFGNPQCAEVKPVANCFEYNTSAWTSVEMKDLTGKAITSISVPAPLSSFGNSSFTMKCYGGEGVYDSGEQRYKLVVKSNTNPGAADNDYIHWYIEDCDFDINADNSAEIWNYQDEDNNDLGSTTKQRKPITFS